MSEAIREAFEALRNLSNAIQGEWADEHFDTIEAALSGAQQGEAEPVAWLCIDPNGADPQAATTEHQRKTYERSGRVILPLYTAPQPAQVPEGWRLVPVEPTTEMLGEGAIALFAQSREPLSSAYRSMLAAAPRCPMLTAAPSGDATLTETARAFDAAPDDAEFGPDHPVFKLAAERDALLFRVRELESGDAKREAEIKAEALESMANKIERECPIPSHDAGVGECLDMIRHEAARLRQSSDGDDSEEKAHG